MDRFVFGLDFGPDGWPTAALPIEKRHAQEMAEMDDKVDMAINRLMAECEKGVSTEEIRERRHELKEVIAEKVAVELNHVFEWNR